MEIKLTNEITKALNERGVCTSATLRYLVSGAADTAGSGSDSALAAIFAHAPAQFGSARKTGVRIAECRGNGNYLVEVEYEYSRVSRQRLSGKRTGDKMWTFSSLGGREHILCGKELLSAVGGSSGITPPDPGLLINWNGRFGDAFRVGGTDIVTSDMRESCILTIDADDLTTRFCRTIGEMTGRVNAAPFHGWDTHEVLFLGAATGTPYANDAGRELVDVTYDFAIRPGIGWDCRWEISQADPASRIVKLIGRYVTRIYNEGNFRALGL